MKFDWKYKLKYWLHSHNMFSKTWHRWHNPYYWWWQVRKYVKRPKAHLVKGEYHGYFGLPCRLDYYKGLQFFCQGLGWKSKYDSPRHEWDPIIVFVLTLPWKTWVNSEYGHETKNGVKGYYKRNSYWFGWVFNWINKSDEDSNTRSMATWEMILDIVNWDHPIGEAENLHHWSSGIDNNSHTIRPINNLTKLGIMKVLEYESNNNCKDRTDN